MMIRLTSSTPPAAGRAVKGGVLYLTNQSPYPPYSGGQLREWQFISRLGRSYGIHLVAVTPDLVRDLRSVSAVLRHCRSVTLFPADPEYLPADRPDRLRQVACPGVGEYLLDLVRRDPVDVVHVEGYFLMQHVPPGLGAPVFLAEENIEYEIERARSELDGRPADQWRTVQALEHDAWRRADACGAVTLDDLAVMRRSVPTQRVHWLPPGCDHFSPDDPGGDRFAELPTTGKRVVYTGSAWWAPSRDATLYLLTEVWPLVQAKVPDARLVIAGNGQVPATLGLDSVEPSVHLCGPLPSLGPLLRWADVFVCPVRYGGGVKSKLLESLHAGCAIASTPAGARGLPEAARRAMLLGGTTAELADAVIALLLDDDLRAEMRRRAAAAAADLPGWDEAIRRLDAAWSAAISAGRSDPTDEAIVAGQRRS